MQSSPLIRPRPVSYGGACLRLDELLRGRQELLSDMKATHSRLDEIRRSGILSRISHFTETERLRSRAQLLASYDARLGVQLRSVLLKLDEFDAAAESLGVDLSKNEAFTLQA